MSDNGLGPNEIYFGRGPAENGFIRLFAEGPPPPPKSQAVIQTEEALRLEGEALYARREAARLLAAASDAVAAAVAAEMAARTAELAAREAFAAIGGPG